MPPSENGARRGALTVKQNKLKTQRTVSPRRLCETSIDSVRAAASARCLSNTFANQ
ncbi:hypothetical protein KGM_210240 [Danaus plexippus plexippus]|uniref:Uncharacterized protein n=1 Tax=Danaus plexippus plexippus TaxID=278856 RepID=A0A212FIU1_DANPL|nr:hypothetical protein KGM_210240 [Danaus plexippus plexippus]